MNMEQKSELLPYAGVNGIGFTLCNLFKRKKERPKYSFINSSVEIK